MKNNSYYETSVRAKKDFRAFLKQYEKKNPNVDSIAILIGLKKVIDEVYDEQVLLAHKKRSW